MSEISVLKNRLLANPIYALSLGSVELFHSNFLDWMFRTYPHMIKAVYDGPVPEIVKVSRELHHLDLIITFNEGGVKKSIVIENKIKDAPRELQLKAYDATIASKFPDHIMYKTLLSLLDAPEWLNSLKGWHFLSYAELGKKIMDLISNSYATSDHLTIIRQYAHLCCDLAALISIAIQTDRPTSEFLLENSVKGTSSREIDNAMEEIRFSDTLKKHRASVLCDDLRRRLPEFNRYELKLDLRHGFDRKMAHVGANLGIERLGLWLGIHIQGRRYCRMIRLECNRMTSLVRDKDPERMRSFIQTTDQWNWMFGEEHIDGVFRNPNGQNGYFKKIPEIFTRQRNKNLLCSYAPKYIYQYTIIGDEQGVPINEVTEAIVTDLHYAELLLTDYSYVERFEEWCDVDGKR